MFRNEHKLRKEFSMFCKNCDSQITDGVKFCANCGMAMVQTAAVSTDVSPPPQAAAPAPQMAVPEYFDSNKKIRNAFTSFCLWTGMVTCGIMAILAVVFGKDINDLINSSLRDREFREYESAYKWYIAGAFLFCGYCYYKMIRWEKSYFWYLAGVQLIMMIAQIYVFRTDALVNIISVTVSLLILFGVLHIRSRFNGKTAWEQMN
jgi:hypothetical protein